MDKTYEAIIKKVREAAAYYETHRDGVCTNDNGTVNVWPTAMAHGSFQALKEILDAFEEPHDWHKANCGEGISCMDDCRKSQLRLTRTTVLAEYKCECGHSWTCNEYPTAVYSMCPKCYRENDPKQRIEQLVRIWHTTDTNQTLAEYLCLTTEQYDKWVQTKLSDSDALMIRNKKKYER
jgi:hypothetical protein